VPVGFVQDAPPSDLSAEDADLIRRGLHRVPSLSRVALWALLDSLRAAEIRGDRAGVLAVVRASYSQHAGVYSLVGELAQRVRRRISRQATARPGPKTWEKTRYRGFEAKVGSAGQWAARSFAWEMFEDLNTAGGERFGPDPRSVFWCHRTRSEDTIGITRRLWFDDAGDLHAEVELGPTPEAQHVGALAAANMVGFSVGCRSESTDLLAEVSPDEWDPLGVADLLVHRGNRVVEISATPSPLLSGTDVVRVW
jgi:hypothetical protein